MDYKTVCGGTFDHFHKGHENFLKSALSISQSLLIGITSDEYIQKSKISPRGEAGKSQKSKVFENFEIRKKNVENYLSKATNGRFEIIKIDDLFGPTLEKNFDATAIVVSENTKAGAKKINQYRSNKDLSKFKIIVVPQLLAEDGKPISSFRIRNGEIDRKGKLYLKPSWFGKILILPQRLREELKKPLGILISNTDTQKVKSINSLIITVGDETSKVFNKKFFIKPDIAVLDFRIAREEKFLDIKDIGFTGKERIVGVKNPAGSITPELINAVNSVFQRDKKDCEIIKVEGEEDLAVLPLILASPLGNYIFYGQYGKGIVRVLVDEKIKAKIRKFVANFNTRGY